MRNIPCYIGDIPRVVPLAIRSLCLSHPREQRSLAQTVDHPSHLREPWDAGRLSPMGFSQTEPHGDAASTVPHCRHAWHRPAGTRWTQGAILAHISRDSMTASTHLGTMQGIPPLLPYPALSTFTLTQRCHSPKECR